MAQQLFSNNVTSSLASGITNVAVAMTVASGEGSKFPNPTGGDWFLVTLFQLSGTTELNWEVVKCTARTGDVLTIVRAQESTSARAFNASDPVSMRFTAGGAANHLQAQNNLSDLTSPSTARTSLGLGTMATQAASAVAITGGTLAGISAFATTSSAGIKNASPSVALHVGDGTAQVTEKIHGAAAANLSPVLSMHRASVAEWANYIDTAAALHFTLNPASYTDANLLAGRKMTLDSSGNLGIGASPLSQLMVAGSTGTGAPVSGGGALLLQDTVGGADGGGSLLFGSVQGYYAGIKGALKNGGSNTQGDMGFYTRQNAVDASLTLRLSINNAGSLLINGAVEDGLHRVQIIGSVRASCFHELSVVKTANYQILASDGVLIGDTTGGNFTMTLPTAIGAGTGYSCTVQIGTKGGNILTIAVPAGQSLNGTVNGTAALGAGVKQVTAISDGGSNWYI